MIIRKCCLLGCAVVLMVSASVMAAGDDPAAVAAKERELIEVLKSDAPKSEKAITCKRLAIYGSEKAVPALEPLLADKELASWARIAIEAIPGPACDTALRNAMNKVQGRLLVGVINSIAVRRDVKAVDGLIAKLGDGDASVASAAGVALGHIGGEKAAAALTKALSSSPADVRSAVAEGCVLCAEGMLAADKTADAIKLYDAVRKADVPEQRHLEAIRGAILARKSAGVPLLIEQLRSRDEEKLGIGLRTARELAGRDVTEALAAEMGKLSADRRPLLLLTIADRNDSAVLPAVLKEARSSRKDLRITAINILIRLGDVSCVPVLLDAATGADADIEAAAVEALVRLPDKAVSADLLARLPKSQGELRRILVDLAGQMQISQALPQVMESLSDSDAGIHEAAVKTIAIIGEKEQIPELVKLLGKTTDSGRRSDLERALTAVCGRSGADSFSYLQPLMKSDDAQLQIMGLHAMVILGGSDSLSAVLSAVEKGQTQVRDEAVRVLSTWPNNWPDDTEAGKALLKLAESAEKTPHQVLALRGYLQYVRGNKKLSSEQKVAEIKDLLAHINRPEEKRQAIAVLADAPCAGALSQLTTLADTPAIAEEAYSAIVQITGKDISGVSKEQRRKALQTVIDKTKNTATKQRARRTLAGIK